LLDLRPETGARRIVKQRKSPVVLGDFSCSVTLVKDDDFPSSTIAR
jgi:hypothetical protein